MLFNTISIILFFVITYTIVYELSMLKDIKPKPLLDFRQSQCLGTCPVFSITIYGDGSVNYDGEQYVDYVGNKKFILSQGALIDIKNMINNLDIDNLKEEYDGNITDLSSTYITFYKSDGSIKKVKARYNIPDKVWAFIEYISTTILTTIKN